MKEKEMPLEERIEKIFESGWVNEFNYLEQLMQETRSCLSKLQQELQRKDNIINELKSSIADYQEAVGDYQDEIVRKDNIINELKNLCELKKIRMLNEKDYSKWYVEGYENAIQTLKLSHSGVMLETIKSAVIKICDEVLDKIKELEIGRSDE